MLNDVLDGKLGWFVWNLSAFGAEYASRLRENLEKSGTNILAIKSYDGPHRFISGSQFEEIRSAVADWPDVRVGTWGYHYGRDLHGELSRVYEDVAHWGADFAILNVEDPVIETDPDTPEKWAGGLEWLRERLPDASLYFCSHAQPAYHPRQPYWQARQHGLIQQPMIYHTAMELAPTVAVERSVESYRQFALLQDGNSGGLLPWSAAGAAYSHRHHAITPGGLLTWASAAIVAGATSLIWWDLDVAQYDPGLLNAIATIDTAAIRAGG